MNHKTTPKKLNNVRKGIYKSCFEERLILVSRKCLSGEIMLGSDRLTFGEFSEIHRSIQSRKKRNFLWFMSWVNYRY